MFDWFVFVDESGDLGSFGTKFFVVVAVQVKDARLLGRIMKKVRERKLKKKLAEVSELKGFNSNPQIRRFVLRKIAGIDCGIYVLAVEKKRVFPELLKNQNKFYNWLCSVLCRQIQSGKIKLVIDKKYDNRFLRAEFNEYVSKHLRGKGIEVEIEHLESASYPPLQAVDFVAWAVNRKYSHGENSYYEIIQGKIVNKGREQLWN